MKKAAMLLADYYEIAVSGPWITSGKDVQYKLVDLADGKKGLFFQYTVSASDWLYNFKFWTVPYKRMNKVWLAHKGFNQLYHSIRDEIMPYFSRITVVGGYSQGAALAQRAIEDIVFNNPNNIPEGYCFGCPKQFVIFPDSADYFKNAFSKTLVINTRGDIVSMVPPPPYSNFGEKKKLATGTWYPSAKAHYMDEYRRGLKHI